MKPLRDLLRHSSIYAIGQILTRIASVLLLPLYTQCLTPTDYGITAILDLTATLLSLMISCGMVTAVTRYHFDEDSAEQHDRIWWTGLTWLTAVSVIVLLPIWLARQFLADVTLGPSVPDGSFFCSCTLATIFVQVAGQYVDGYLRVRKWSVLFVLIALGRLILNVCLNVWLLVGMKMGVAGLLIGNLLASCMHSAVLLVVFMKTRGPFQFSLPLAKGLIRFSAPLVVTGILAMLMHEADRYVLRALVTLDEVGVYSLAHKIGFAVNTLCLLPFSSIWHVAIYDIERLPRANETFAKVFSVFVSGMGIVLLGAALTVHPVLPLLTPEAYGDAVDLISVILLGFFFFGLQLQFEVPALLERKTGLLVPGSVVGVAINLAANFLLIPVFGLWGAAWAGVLTYAAFSLTTLLLCRRIRAINYPWLRSSLTVAAFCGCYGLLRYVVFPQLGTIGQLVTSVTCCGVWSILLLGRSGLDFRGTRPTTTKTTDPAAGSVVRNHSLTFDPGFADQVRTESPLCVCHE